MIYQQIDDNAVPLDYGYPKQWRIALVDDNGNILQQTGLGYTSVCDTTMYAIEKLKVWLVDNPCAALHGHPREMLLGQMQRNFHSYRLLWGKQLPDDPFCGFADGESLDFRLVWAANGVVQETSFSGTLPSNWWSLDSEERQWLLEDMLA
jgi:hypothetical protein